MGALLKLQKETKSTGESIQWGEVSMDTPNLKIFLMKYIEHSYINICERFIGHSKL